MSNDKSEFATLNDNYQKCINKYYDQFFDGKDVEFNNICTEELEKIKNFDYYKSALAEYNDYAAKEEQKLKEKPKEKDGSS